MKTIVIVGTVLILGLGAAYCWFNGIAKATNPEDYIWDAKV